VTRQNNYWARQVIGARIRRTLIAVSDVLTRQIGASVRLKLEHLQMTGSFKVRGALNAIARLSPGNTDDASDTRRPGGEGKARP
jgi:threonine dehydratase